VRTRLHRALERLSVRLDAAHGGERRPGPRWCFPGRSCAMSGSRGLPPSRRRAS
jgi:hypothetical protein